MTGPAFEQTYLIGWGEVDCFREVLLIGTVRVTHRPEVQAVLRAVPRTEDFEMLPTSIK
jgi:hypothetical protein